MWLTSHLRWSGSRGFRVRQEWGLFLILEEKVSHSLLVFLLLIPSHFGTVNIYHECFIFPTSIMKTCWCVEKLKEVYSESQYTYHLASIINDLLCLLYHVSIDLSPYSPCLYSYISPVQKSMHIIIFLLYSKICCSPSWMLLLSILIQDGHFSNFRHLFFYHKGLPQWL